jgi:type II secretory pathway pseudopilin PulG
MRNKKIKNRVKVRKFTLIELVSVIIIMAFVMAIGIPAFSGMFKGQAVGNSTTSVAQLLKLSRNYSIANHAYIAVVIPQKGHPTSGIPDRYYNTAMRPAVVKPDGNGKFKFYKWVDGESWTFLQPGTAILEADNDDTPIGSHPSVGYCPIVNEVDCSDISDSGSSKKINNMTAIVFRYNGHAYPENGKNYTIEVGRGVVTPNGVKILSEGEPMKIEVSTSTGMIYIDK